MNALQPIHYSEFYKLCLRVFGETRIPLYRTSRSKKMYGNFVHVFLLILKERLKTSYRGVVKFCKEFGIQRMLCIKRLPHFTTIQKALQRISRVLFEKMVRACRKIIGLSGMVAAIDGTGFSNINPSHYYLNRIDGKPVKNFTKTVLLADLNTKLVLNLSTHTNHANETLDFIPLVKELRNSLRCVLADKAYDSTANRKHCWENEIEVHIPLREWKQGRKGYGHKENFQGKLRKRARKLFNSEIYKRRALIESINSAVKRVFGSWICSRKPENQRKQATLKIIAYNLEVLGHKIKGWLFIFAA